MTSQKELMGKQRQRGRSVIALEHMINAAGYRIDGARQDPNHEKLGWKITASPLSKSTDYGDVSINSGMDLRDSMAAIYDMILKRKEMSESENKQKDKGKRRRLKKS